MHICKACGHDRFKTKDKRKGIYQCRRCFAQVTNPK